MALERKSVDSSCKDGFTCPSVWADDGDLDNVVVVGEVLDPAPIPVGPGEIAVRVRRQVIQDANL